MPRETADVIALLLAAVVSVTVLSTTAAILYVALLHPEQDISRAVTIIGQLVSVLVGAVVGYIAGRTRGEP